MAGTSKAPKQSKVVRLHLDIPDEMFTKLKEKARELEEEAEVPGTQVPLSVVVRQAIWAFVK